MRPSSKEIIDGISWVLNNRVAPHATEAWAASSLRSVAGLLKHLSVRVESEGQILSEDNSDLRALLMNVAARLGDGSGTSQWTAEVRASLDKEWRATGSYPTVGSLEEENYALNSHLEKFMHLLHDAGAGIRESETTEIEADVGAYLKRQMERERPLYNPPFTGPPF
ncbi:MAG TPA: hypothetical protein QGF35_03590 [Dehalococcoidia bacterium]|jgi:hypothetical protein|nr:hypothetical protein [Dehalococcoidia bacterium]